MSKTTDLFLERPTHVRWQILALLLAFSFMNWLNRTSIAVAYDLRIQEQYGISELDMGYVYSALFLAYTLFMTPGGWVADRRGARATLLFVGFGSALFAVATGLLGTVAHTLGFAADQIWVCLLFIRFGMGTCMAPIYPASGRAVGHWIPSHGRASANGLITGAALLGIASNFLILGKLIDWFDWPVALMICGLVTALVTLLWALWARDRPEQHPRVNKAELRLIAAETSASAPADKAANAPVDNPSADSWRTLLRNRSLMFLTVSYAAVGYFEYLFFFWILHYFGKVLHLGETQSRYYSCIAMLAMAGGMVVGGRLCDFLQRSYGRRYARLCVAAGGMLAGAALLFCGLRSGTPVWIVAWFSLALAAVGASEGPFWTTAIELGGRRSGTACGIFNTGGNIGGVLAPSVTPFVFANLPLAWDAIFRWKVAISLGAVVCILGAALWWKIDPNTETK
ncbi:MAG TPA: MFS transporter [Gemmataceae bacterium]|nr:MFS transporter [Gemmataceae bacterium]